MKKKEDRNTRYYIDLDLKTGKIIQLDCDQKEGLAQELPLPHQQRVFLTKGQYNKLLKKYSELKNSP
ncbi:MAG TPA: hypothetical protein PLJ29_05460 [Leptospiraceae bacterium]|nr:hypothetical protein [Leptospiraceae bacterium]HNH06923.1 hypothetical protein [Leptospiraceae bacterium]HNI25785.1 hypothetical protein [Leptospiraceae bacterium]HNI97475.1 hypothetical protein [Leptospiraceae bacterium]HNM02393.1 hypothetical protein [Leptospiraceae bacterium]